MEWIGIKLKCSRGDFVLRSTFGCLLADEKGSKECLSLKWASGSKTCCFCRYVLGRAELFHDHRYFVHVASTDVAKFDFHAQSSFDELCTLLVSEVSEGGSKARVAAMERTFGIKFEKHAVAFCLESAPSRLAGQNAGARRRRMRRRLPGAFPKHRASFTDGCRHLFSGGCEGSFQKIVTFYRAMGTSLPMVTHLPRDGMPSSTGGEPVFRAVGTSLPKDGTAFPKAGKPFLRGSGDRVTKMLPNCYQNPPGVLPKCYQTILGC